MLLAWIIAAFLHLETFVHVVAVVFFFFVFFSSFSSAMFVANADLGFCLQHGSASVYGVLARIMWHERLSVVAIAVMSCLR